MSPVLDIRNLSKNFGSIEILKNINISIDEGDFLVLVGPSGCGKSTLLNCLSGLDTPDEGTIIFDGEELTGSRLISEPLYVEAVWALFFSSSICFPR